MNCPHMRRKDSLVGTVVAWTLLVACGRSSLESGSGTASDPTGGQASLPDSIATTSGGSFARSARTTSAVTAGSGGIFPSGEGGTKPTGEGGTMPTGEGGAMPTGEGGTKPTGEGGTMPMGGVSSTGGSLPNAAGAPTTAPNLCNVTVNPPESMQSAIDACPSPGTVCIGPGLYRENIRLRDGVNLYGSGANAHICGLASGDEANQLGVELRALSVRQIKAQGSVKLELLDLDVAQPTTDCPTDLSNSIDIARTLGSGIKFSATRVKIAPWGFVINLGNSDVPVNDVISIVQSRCTNPQQCWDFLNVTRGSSSSGMLPAGSRLNMELSNNLVPNVVLEGIVIAGHENLLPEDAAASRIVIRHNTIISPGDWNYGIDLRGNFAIPTVIANNAIAYLMHPIEYSSQLLLPAIESANCVSRDAASKDWFQSYKTGDFTPSIGSPLVGGGDPEYGLPIDIDGRPRVGHYDVGAYQRP